MAPCILPESLVWSKENLVQLPHPLTNTPCLFMLSKDMQLFQLTRLQRSGSCFYEDSVMEGLINCSLKPRWKSDHRYTF